MTVTLITFTKKGDRKTFDLTKPKVVIGRKTDADLRVPLADISRSHCELTLKNGHVQVRDLDSSNGTYVNGEQVTEKDLAAGDLIRLGPITFTVQIDGQPEAIEPPTQEAAAAKAGSQAPTIASKQKTDSETDDFDIDDLDDFDIDDMSDLDLDEDFDLSDDLEEVDDLEEINEDDVIDDGK
ncbi:MAG: FHA domain-containing protein [Phycisphaerales bacterium]|nr:FHA domain-containing protein [Phycisphaerales bacterium]MCB9855997.1 FHA domain-containing protein [Phycisphaerales bacterium]MCB9864976.1 FHA domain-containing protein [Phycisphaerales bacterium]